MASALDRVIDQAESASANLPATQPPQNLVQTSPNPVGRPSLQSMADSAGIQVDQFLTIKDTGFRLGDSKTLFNEATVRINMNEVVPIVSLRANRGGSTTFIKSYDGVTTSQGQSFALAESNLRNTHDKVDGPYQTAEIPATLLADVAGGKKGETIGVTPPITGVKFFTKFYKELQEKNLENATVDVKLIHTPQTNKNGNEWGVVTFELIGEASE
jgi:hypothetical protein